MTKRELEEPFAIEATELVESELLLASGVVLVLNCAPPELTGISVNGNQLLSANQVIPPISLSSPWISAVAIRRGQALNQFPDSGLVSVFFDGVSKPKWTYTISLPNTDSWLNYYLWCFINGYALGTASGNLSGVSWQIPWASLRLKESNE